MSRRSLSLSTLSAIVVGLGATSAAHGAGFQLLEQNASGLGNAYGARRQIRKTPASSTTTRRA